MPNETCDKCGCEVTTQNCSITMHCIAWDEPYFGLLSHRRCIRCSPSRAQHIVHPDFEPVALTVNGDSTVTFNILDNLHKTSLQNNNFKYLAFFGTCKMWDKSWEILEHPDFTIKPHIDNDYDNWWSLKYTMTKEEMNKINEKTEDLEVLIAPQHKFNGCGLVISSEVIKSGVNIPRSAFFVHEDTSFMLMTQKILGNIPQYIIKNILLVHNRNHPKKRMYIKGERKDGTMNEKRRSNSWYVKANKMSEQNCYNTFNPNYKSFTWEDVWK